jgi:hypothetical protein
VDNDYEPMHDLDDPEDEHEKYVEENAMVGGSLVFRSKNSLPRLQNAGVGGCNGCRWMSFWHTDPKQHSREEF